MTFCMSLGIVLTFSLVLHSISSAELFDLFINGRGHLGSEAVVQSFLDALAIDYYVIVAVFFFQGAGCASGIPKVPGQRLLCNWDFCLRCSCAAMCT